MPQALKMSCIHHFRLVNKLIDSAEETAFQVGAVPPRGWALRKVPMF